MDAQCTNVLNLPAEVVCGNALLAHLHFIEHIEALVEQAMNRYSKAAGANPQCLAFSLTSRLNVLI